MVLAPATTCAFVTRYPGATMTAVPVICDSHAWVTTRAVLAAAARAIRSARGSLGTSTGSRGIGSRPTNTSGRPESSMTPAIPETTSVGGGR